MKFEDKLHTSTINLQLENRDIDISELKTISILISPGIEMVCKVDYNINL